MVKRLHQLIDQKGEIEAAMEKLQKMQISSGNITTIQEDDEEQCEIDTKEEMLPHNDIEDFTEQQSDDKKTVVVKSYDNISVSANQGGKVLTKEQQRTRTFMAKYSDGKVEMPRLNVAMKQDTSATLVAKETGLKPTPPQKHKLQVAVEETAATPPQYKHGAVHELPLDQAIELWQEQHRKQEDFGGNMNPDMFKFNFQFVENPEDGDTPSYVQLSLSSFGKQRVHLEKLGLDIDFCDGESINFYEGPNTSCKWNMKQLLRLAERSGFAVDALWTNDEDSYCVICLAPAGVSEF
uniref:Histidine-specific methyltransferase SAM-dependent domain-containing protein n=1 Tax=Branchiostoma floridae TaxID=7739 RepID=C3Y1U9_BRAFL|eukprot:XP_002609829.1 hypothetical protein BRAFLDRAFT_78675 [Branchiostoma floridae]